MQRQVTISVAALLLAGATGACKRANEATQKESAAAAAVPTQVESKGALATRREAQDHLDKARESFVQKDLSTAATEIRSAATFLREQADSATGEPKEYMTNSARELDTLASDVEKNTVKTVKRLDYAFARTQRAEAERHHANAVAAWARKENARVADELTMAADHFERAAKDAGEVLLAGSQKTLTDTRDIADQMRKGADIVPDKVDTVIDALGKEIRALGAKIEKRKA